MSPWTMTDRLREVMRGAADAVLQWAWAQRFTDGVRARLRWALAAAQQGHALPTDAADLETAYRFDVQNAVEFGQAMLKPHESEAA